MQIEGRIRQFIVEKLYFAENNSLRDQDSFLETGVIDSMGVMELVAFVQSEFGVSVEQREVVVENFDSIQKLAEFIRRKARTEPCTTTSKPSQAAAEPSALEEAAPRYS
jgi:acyl carrier protein